MSSRIQPQISAAPIALLERLLSRLELTASQRADLERSYGAVTDALKASKALSSILSRLELRAQGSVRAGTVVRPSGQVDFDLDVLCWMEFLGPGWTPETVWQLIWEALGEHGTYQPMRSRKDRCVRLDFAAGYHLDITPAIPDPNRSEPSLLVPDRAKKIWSPSNPIKFCDGWFKPITLQLPVTVYKFSLSSDVLKSEGMVAARETRVEPLPDDSGFAKAPLQRIVQLVKYLRDEHYSSEDKDRPSSILLTTIAAQAYSAEVQAGHTSLGAFILAVLSLMRSYVRVDEVAGGFAFTVTNPVEERENFADRWTLQTYRKFDAWTRGVCQQIATLLKSVPQGLNDGIQTFETAIPGAKRFRLADDIGKDARRLHDGGGLQLRTIPGVAASLTPIPATTFFGNP